MPDENKATKADQVTDENLEEEVGAAVDESSTEEDEHLDELLGQLHDGAPLDEEEEEGVIGEDEGVDEDEEVGLTPSGQHSLSVATKKDQRIKELEALLAAGDGAQAESNTRLARLERLIIDRAEQTPNEPVPAQPSYAEQKTARVKEIVDRINSKGDIDFVTGDKDAILSQIVGELTDAQDQRTHEWLGQNEELQMLSETRRLAGIVRNSPSLTRFVQHPETTKQLRAMKTDQQSMQEAYADPDTNRQKAMLLDVMTARADGTTRRIAEARTDRRKGRKETGGAFSPRPANRTGTRPKKRQSLADRTAEMTEEQFGEWVQAASKKAEAEEAEMSPGL